MNISATPTLKTTAAAPLAVHFLGNLLTFRARSADTGGALSIVESWSAPGAGAPPHLQQDTETFLVLEGQFEFMLDGETRISGPGECVHVSPGMVHAFRNPCATPSRMLIINTPGGMHEGFFLAVGDQVAPDATDFPPMGPPDIAFISESAAQYGITILPPPGA